VTWIDATPARRAGPPVDGAAARRYAERGYLCPLEALSSAEAAALRSRLESYEARAGATLGKLPGQLRAKSHLLFPWLADLVRHPALLDAAGALIGPDLLVYHVTCWIKEPRDASFVPWHQDATYFNLEPFEHVTAWVALSPSRPDSGCVRVIPGTHRDGQRRHGEQPSDANLLSNGQHVLDAVDDGEAVDLVLEPGQMSLHHTHLVHASEPNVSADRRIGIGISYIPTRVRFTGAGRITASLVRGEDAYGHFDPEPRPAGEADDDARAFHAEACRRFFSSHGSARSAVVEARA